jgi:hypothetical protein
MQAGARSSVDRASGCGPEGRGFESRRARHLPSTNEAPGLSPGALATRRRHSAETQTAVAWTWPHVRIHDPGRDVETSQRRPPARTLPAHRAGDTAPSRRRRRRERGLPGALWLPRRSPPVGDTARHTAKLRRVPCRAPPAADQPHRVPSIPSQWRPHRARWLPPSIGSMWLHGTLSCMILHSTRMNILVDGDWAEALGLPDVHGR